VLYGPLDDKQKARLMDVAGTCPVRRAVAMPAYFFEEMAEGDLLPAE
jgi:hypothetical protein